MQNDAPMMARAVSFLPRNVDTAVFAHSARKREAAADML